MAVSLGELKLDPVALDDLLHNPEGPVGRLIAELSMEASQLARERAHVFSGTPGSKIRFRVSSSICRGSPHVPPCASTRSSSTPSMHGSSWSGVASASAWTGCGQVEPSPVSRAKPHVR